MPLTVQRLCDAFSERSIAVRDLIDFSYDKGLGVSEETLTDVMLVELQRSLFPHVITRKFTKKQENKTSGADWLWSIGRPGRWFSILVQAKLVRPTNMKSLHGLHHGKGAQRNKLVAYAAKQSCFPLYVIYTPSGAPTLTPVVCPRLAARADLAGCSVVRPGHVASMFRRAKGRTNVARLLSASFPMSCLVCCPAVPATGELADIAAGGVAGLLTIDSATADRSTERGHVDAGEDPKDPAALIADRAPDIVEALLRGREIRDPEVGIVTVLSSEPIAASRIPGQ